MFPLLLLFGIGGLIAYEMRKKPAAAPKPAPIDPIAIPGLNLLSSALFQVGPDGIIEFSDVGWATAQARLADWMVVGTSPVDGAMFIEAFGASTAPASAIATQEIAAALSSGVGVYLDTGVLTNSSGVVVFSPSETTPPIQTDVQDRPPMPIDVDTAMSAPSLVRIPSSAIDPSHFSF